MSANDRNDKVDFSQVGFVFVPDPDLKKNVSSKESLPASPGAAVQENPVIIISSSEEETDTNKKCGTSEDQLSEDELPTMIWSPIRKNFQLSDDDDLHNDYDDSSKHKRPKVQSSQDDDLDTDSDDSSKYRRYDGEWYNAERKTPVFKWPGKRFDDNKKLCKYLLEPADADKLCTAVPRNVAHNTIFLLNKQNLKHPYDWKCDDMGAWKHNGKHISTLAILKGGLIEVGDSFSPSKKMATYILHKRYYKNHNDGAVRKSVSWLEGNPDLLCIQYSFQEGEKSLNVRPHGNARYDTESYVRTKKSTKIQLQDICATNTPKMAYQKANEQLGGIVRASSHSDLPRGKEQARYIKKKQSGNTDKIDSLVVMLEQCKRQQLSRNQDLFIQEVVGGPELRCVLSFKWQIKEIVVFCTDPRNFTILGADPTFNLGKFNLTVTSYQNLKVVDKKTGKQPIMIGPVFMSQSKSFDAYHYFFSKMVGLVKGSTNIMAFGTDGEEQLYTAMERAFPQAIHLRCFNHFRENCVAKLRQSNLPDTEIKLFLNEIFGRRIGDVFEEGLLDAMDEEDLKVKTFSLEETWKERERKHLPPNQECSFYDYFVERFQMMSSSMLKEVRVNAGLGDPPSQFFTNIPESANAIIKRAVSFKESEMTAFCSKMEEIARHQRSEVENAIISKGPYKLAKSHQSFSITTEKWFRMSTKQRELHLKKFHESDIMPVTANSAVNKEVEQPGSHSSPVTSGSALSVPANDAGLSNIPLMSLENMYSKAEEMLSRQNAMLPAPGDGTSFMVESFTNSRPHFVTHDVKTNKITCDDCPAWTSFKVCSHALAVGEKIGKLQNFFKWHSKKAPPANITSLMTTDSSKGVGKKGSKSSTSRRRGGRYNEPSSTITHLPMRQAATHVQLTPGTGSASSKNMPLNSGTIHVQLTPGTGSPSYQNMPLNCATTIHHNRSGQQSTVVPQNMPTTIHHNSSVQNLSHSHRNAPSPSNGIFELHFLHNCPSQVSVCFGCSQALKPGGAIGNPPYDLVVVSRMPRQFLDSNGNMQSREGNVYFHAVTGCIGKKQPYFGGLMIPLTTEMDLLQEHEDLLSREFGLNFSGL